MAEEYTVAHGKPGVARVIQVDPDLAADAPQLLCALREIIRFVDSAGNEDINRVPFVYGRALLHKHKVKL